MPQPDHGLVGLLCILKGIGDAVTVLQRFCPGGENGPEEDGGCQPEKKAAKLHGNGITPSFTAKSYPDIIQKSPEEIQVTEGQKGSGKTNKTIKDFSYFAFFEKIAQKQNKRKPGETPAGKAIVQKQQRMNQNEQRPKNVRKKSPVTLLKKKKFGYNIPGNR
ncbi:MAG: hypothetical protein IKH18_10330 [Clostridia bacterium]|nr:hypothetical protein [Clostridia bacterium]